MAQVLIRDLGSEVVDKLKERAKFRGRSLEAELRLILEQAAQDTRRQGLAELESIRERLAGKTFSDSAEMLREDRDR